MNIAVSVIDYKLASLEQRELFAFDKFKLAEIYKMINEDDNIKGSVIISTCNRTEIYVNMKEKINPFNILCKYIGVDIKNYENSHISFYGEKAILHLFKVACGMKSQIWGEDQIITQVKNSLIIARENEAVDPTLEVLFRNAVSGAKKVKTDIDFKTDNNSTAKCAVKIISQNEEIQNVLVIGNGEIGRLTAELLTKQGLNATMTLRSYKHKDVVIPKNVSVVEYSERYSMIEKVDAVVSATASPHFTIDYFRLIKLKKLPKIIIDLAVPRDIDPMIESISDIGFYNIDNLDTQHISYHKFIHKKKSEDIFSKYLDNIYKWHEYKLKLMPLNTY